MVVVICEKNGVPLFLGTWPPHVVVLPLPSHIIELKKFYITTLLLQQHCFPPSPSSLPLCEPQREGWGGGK